MESKFIIQFIRNISEDTVIITNNSNTINESSEELAATVHSLGDMSKKMMSKVNSFKLI